MSRIRDYLVTGNIRNSVTYPEVVIPHNGGHWLGIANTNVPNME